MRPDITLTLSRLAALPMLLALGGLILLAACSSGGAGGGSTSGQPEPAAQATQSPSQPTAAASANGTQKNPDVQVDACKLLAKAEIESAVGAPVLEPLAEQLANLSTCSYGDPEAPLLGGRSVAQTVVLSVFAGRDAAQARGAYQIARRNAGDLVPVTGVGEEAYWVDILETLNVLKGRYFIGVEARRGGVEAAKGLASKMLGKLP